MRAGSQRGRGAAVRRGGSRRPVRRRSVSKQGGAGNRGRQRSVRSGPTAAAGRRRKPVAVMEASSTTSDESLTS